MLTLTILKTCSTREITPVLVAPMLDDSMCVASGPHGSSYLGCQK